MAVSASTLPHWDMTDVFRSLESPEFEGAFRSAVRSIDELSHLFDRHRIGQRDPGPTDGMTTEVFESALSSLNTVLAEVETLGAYIHSFVATDSRNALAQARRSELQQQNVRLSLLSTRFTAWIGSLDVEALIQGSSLARDHAFQLRKTRVRATHLMSPLEEDLAAQMNVTGTVAWAKLHGNYTSQILVSIELGGQKQELPMSQVRNLALDPDRMIRRRAYEAELAAWSSAAVPLAAALNSIKGETNLLSRRRGWASPLDSALFDNNMDRQTFEAMLAAARESFPDFRRYLRAKARALGLPLLAWYDLFAPVGQATREWPFEEATQFIVDRFGTYSPRLSELAQRAFDSHWIDAEPRPGKVDGGFCMRVRDGESRILVNYTPAFERGVSTLAHELGHAYHNLMKGPLTPIQRITPMTLAETASIFCETLVTQAALHKADPQEQLTILEAGLQGACQVVVDIISRFLFEQAVFNARRDRELSIEELNTLMLDAQKQTYGDGLDPKALHPYMWAVKSHYYGSTFYNYPYMFGLLFGLGLYARYLEAPQTFLAGYDDLLASTGLGEAAELAGRFGIDIRSQKFWRTSLDVIRADIDRFESLVGDAPRQQEVA